MRSDGLTLNENPDGSNNNWSENLQGLKNKVSSTMTIITGLVLPKKPPNWSLSMENPVNIPELYVIT